MSSKRVAVGKDKDTKPVKATRVKKVETVVQEQEQEQEQKPKRVVKKATSTKKKEPEPESASASASASEAEPEPEPELKKKTKPEPESESEADTDNEVTKWTHNEEERVESLLVITKQNTESKPEPESKSSHKDTRTNTRPDTRPNVSQSQFSQYHKQNKSAALQFRYDDFRNTEYNTNQVSTPDLLRFLIVRSNDAGQLSLKRCLENTLRAVNLECNFPTLPSLNSHSKQTEKGKTETGQSETGQTETGQTEQIHSKPYQQRRPYQAKKPFHKNPYNGVDA